MRTREYGTLQSFYEVEFFPAWARGPGDAGNYHLSVAKLTEEFKTVVSAKASATETLTSHNRENRDEKWRAEISHVANGRKRRSMNGVDEGFDRPHIKWTRA
jgi:hypothetical protein